MAKAVKSNNNTSENAPYTEYAEAKLRERQDNSLGLKEITDIVQDDCATKSCVPPKYFFILIPQTSRRTIG